MDRRLHSAAELVPLLPDDRELRDELAHAPREVVDLRRRRRSPGEDAEIDAHLDLRLFVRPHAERDRRLYLPRGSHWNFNAVNTTPATPQAARMAIASGCVQKP